MNESSGSPLARTVLGTLQDRIVSGQWPVGSRIPTEPELTAELGVGRSTVREAIRSLATLGMVETLTARGTFVRSRTPAPSILLGALAHYSPGELVSCRRALDVEAVQSAAAQWRGRALEPLEAVLHTELEAARRPEAVGADYSACSHFHGEVARASGNRLLADLGASLTVVLHASGIEAEISSALEPAVCLGEHDRILGAIRSRDVATAAHLMAMHLDATLRSLDHEPIVTDLTTLLQAQAAAEESTAAAHPQALAAHGRRGR